MDALHTLSSVSSADHHAPDQHGDDLGPDFAPYAYAPLYNDDDPDVKAFGMVGLLPSVPL